MNSVTEYTYLVEKQYQGFDGALWQRLAVFPTRPEAEECLERIREAAKGRIISKGDYRVVLVSYTVLGEYRF